MERPSQALAEMARVCRPGGAWIWEFSKIRGPLHSRGYQADVIIWVRKGLGFAKMGGYLIEIPYSKDSAFVFRGVRVQILRGV